jgi:hypothetical protein
MHVRNEEWHIVQQMRWREKKESSFTVSLSLSPFFFLLLVRLLGQGENSSSIVYTHSYRQYENKPKFTNDNLTRLLARLIVLVLSFFCVVVVALYATWSYTTSIIPTMTLTIYTCICIYIYIHIWMYTTHIVWSVSYVQPQTISWISLLSFNSGRKERE